MYVKCCFCFFSSRWWWRRRNWEQWRKPKPGVRGCTQPPWCWVQWTEEGGWDQHWDACLTPRSIPAVSNFAGRRWKDQSSFLGPGQDPFPSDGAQQGSVDFHAVLASWTGGRWAGSQQAVIAIFRHDPCANNVVWHNLCQECTVLWYKPARLLRKRLRQ